MMWLIGKIPSTGDATVWEGWRLEVWTLMETESTRYLPAASLRLMARLDPQLEMLRRYEHRARSRELAGRTPEVSNAIET